MRWLLIGWLAAYPIIVGAQLLIAMNQIASQHAVSGAIFVAGALLIPWLIGLAILGWLTYRSRRAGRPPSAP
jgi:hypothetical protein